MPVEIYFSIPIALLLAGLALLVLRATPEPITNDPDLVFKIHYRDLVDWRFVLIVLAAVLAAQLPLLMVPLKLWPLWIVHGSLTLVLTACDARTTWLPIRLTYLCWFFAGLAAVFGSWQYALFGAASAGAMFWLIWRFTNSFGFGDVRLALLVGATAGSLGMNFWFTAIFCSTLASALYGLVVNLWRRNHPSKLNKAFAYGPGLWFGPYLALTLHIFS